MRKHAVVIGLTFAGLGLFAVLAGWTFFQASQPGGRGWTLGPIRPYLVGAALVGASFVGLLIWLGFYAVRHGYEERDPEL